MLTAYVPAGTDDLVNRQTEAPDYKAMYDGLFANYDKLKEEHAAQREKIKELQETKNVQDQQLAKLTAKYMSAKYALEAAERCIVNMSLKLHGGEEYA